MLAVGVIAGGLTGYKIGIHRSGIQKQKAKSDSKQRQELDIEGKLQGQEKWASKNVVRQTQKAGKKSEQVQIGRSHDGE